MKQFGLFLLALSLVSFTSCKDTEVKKASTGGAGEIVVVVSKADWESEIGSTIRSILAKDYPFLPQSEPQFNLMCIPKNAMGDVFSAHRFCRNQQLP